MSCGEGTAPFPIFSCLKSFITTASPWAASFGSFGSSAPVFSLFWNTSAAVPGLAEVVDTTADPWSIAWSARWVTITLETPSCGESPINSSQSISSRRRAVDTEITLRLHLDA